MPHSSEPTPVYFHHCNMLGPETRVPKALVADAAGEYILYYQNRCPSCGYVARGTKKFATGVTPDTLGGYYIDEKIAEKLR